MIPQLDKRALTILKTVVEEFIKSGTPVGSRAVAKKSELSLSPATIRNIMSDLEEWGFLEQTHVSSGRLPTDIGYRCYVDNFSMDFILREKEQQGFDTICSNSTVHIENLIRRVTVFLSQSSRLVGVVLAPKIQDMLIKRIAFIKLSHNKVLSVIVSESGFVSNNVISDKWNLTQESLERMSALLNDKLAGLRFSEYRKILLEMMVKEKGDYERMIAKAINLGVMALAPPTDSQVFVEGQGHIVENSEFFNAEKVKTILSAFEEKSRLMNILDRCTHSKGIQIFIGSENEDIDMRDFSFVLSKYAVNGVASGAVGVIGPKRMEYSKAIPLVEHAADVLNKVG